MSASTATTIIATLTVTTGPDRGQVFPLVDEFIHIGSGADSQVLLTDSQVAEHLASLANRNGRYAIFTPIDNAISVDGNSMKADQWVWLPSRATIKITSKTTLTFQAGSNDPTATPTEKLPEASPPPVAAVKSKAQPRRAGAKKGDAAGTAGRAVAKFITDRPGEMLVKLGEDGHLPELALQEAAAPKTAKQKEGEKGNPALVYGALGFSLLASMAMMFLEPETFDERRATKTTARREIVSRFIGDEKGPARPYQRLLREAGLAHSRGDFRGERDAYLAVLNLLNAEDRNAHIGITGDLEDDEKLKGYLAILLGR
ncbi:MAG: FHA domain-containing protein [Planctomycetota bacterium]